MAAVYIHNALFSPDHHDGSPPSGGARPVSGHGRTQHQHQLSQHSIVTLTTTTTHTLPTESILHSTPSVSSAYHDLLARQPPHPSEVSPAWDAGLSFNRSPVLPSLGGVLGHRERTLLRRLRRLRMAKIPFEIVIGGWTTYTTIRYFITFSVTPAHDIEIISLSLGTSSVLSLCLLLAAIFLSILTPHSWRGSHAYSVLTQTLLPYSSSIFVILPAIVNLVLIALLRRRSSLLQITRTCPWDVDIVWAGNGDNCSRSHGASWAAWLAGAIARLVLTIVVSGVYHVIAHIFYQTQDKLRSRTSRRQPRPFLVGNPVSLPFPISPALQPILNATTPPMSPGAISPYPSPSLLRQSRTSYLFETQTPGSPPSADRKSLRSSRSRIASTRDGVQTLSRNSQSSSSHGHDEESESEGHGGSSVETVVGAHQRPGLKQNTSSSDAGHQGQNGGNNMPQEQELLEFVDRFRTLVTQITRETEEGMQFADSPRVVNLDEDEEDSESGSGTDARSMTPEDYISMLGGYVRRMPTIESLGSREVMSRSGTSSRPPTRTNTVSMSEQGSQPPSRSNSLNWRGLDAVAVGNGGGETSRSRSGSGSQSQKSVVRSGSVASRRSFGLASSSSPAESPVEVEFPVALEGRDDEY